MRPIPRRCFAASPSVARRELETRSLMPAAKPLTSPIEPLLDRKPTRRDLLHGTAPTTAAMRARRHPGPTGGMATADLGGQPAGPASDLGLAGLSSLRPKTPTTPFTPLDIFGDVVSSKAEMTHKPGDVAHNALDCLSSKHKEPSAGDAQEGKQVGVERFRF